MTTTLRAALSIAMLVGFYVVAVATLVGLGLVAVLAFRGGAEQIGVKVGFVLLLAAAGIVVSLWRVARAKPEPEPGVVLTPQDAPELWAQVTELAAAAATRVPDEIRLVPEVNAAVSEDARLLGLVPGTRRLYLGVPLLMGLDVARLRSVLGHELGHYSRSHTRLAPIAYRGQNAIIATVQQLSGNVVGWFLTQYAKLYLLVSAGVTRSQELEADEISVRVAGRGVAQSALRELPVVDSAWSFYEGAYLGGGWELGLAPTSDRFFAGFGELLAGRADELAQVRAEAPPAEQSRWDTHPSIAARIAAMEAMADVDVPVDTRPATVLIPALAQVATRLAEEVVAFGDRRRVGWEELTATAAAQHCQLTADVVFRAAARVAGRPTGDLGVVLDLVQDGRSAELLRALGADPADGPPPASEQPGSDRLGGPAVGDGPQTPLLDALASVLGASVVQAGAARWRHSWSGPAELVTPAGEVVDVEALAALAADPSAVALARTALAELGVDPDRARQVGERATAHGAQLLAGMANVKVNGAAHDVLLLDRGLVLVPSPTRKKEGGAARLAQIVDAAPSPVALAEAHGFVPFEDVARATLLKRAPVHVDLALHSGEVLELRSSWTGETLTKDCLGTYIGVAEELAARPTVVG